MNRIGLCLSICLLPLAIPRAQADETDWAEDSATRDSYNGAGKLKWKNPMGDWHDARNVAQGDAPYATASPAKENEFVEWDVTALVKEWVGGTFPNQGFYLRMIEGGGTLTFASRQRPEPAHHPQLVLSSGGKTATLAAVADVHLEGSTHRSLGDSPALKISGGARTLLRFDLRETKAVDRATLRLFLSARSGDKATVGVFRCSQSHRLPPSEPEPGLAVRYPGDRGIEKDPDVVFATGFESEDWKKEWTYAEGKLDPVDADPERGFEPFQGKALRGTMAQGGNGCMNVGYKFRDKTGSEPEEIYFRYYVRLGSTWNQTVDGGKMPGMAGRYGRAGNGGSKSDGFNGWSARGSFMKSISGENPLAGTHPIGTYCYHADMKGFFGEGWAWNNGYRGFLRTNRWYSVETYIKLNTVEGKEGRKDGILRGWVDGRLAIEKTDIRFRHTEALNIEEIWLNVYHGGTAPCPHDQHLYVDNVVVARRYIGPVMPLGRRG